MKMARNKGRIGVIVPSSNTNLETDCFLLAPKGVTLHFTRVGGYDIDDIPDENVQRDFASQSLDDTLNLLTPAEVNVIAYGCTSATLAHGYQFDRAFQQDITNKTGVPAITAAGAIIEALSTLGVSQIAFTSPYVAQLNNEAINFFAKCNIETVSYAGLEKQLSSKEQNALTPDDAYTLACQADSSQAEAIVISCTDFRALEVVEVLEQELGKPVVTSNKALMYVCLKQLGVDTSGISMGGQLFSKKYN
jgi:maleate cis-trans isomerase